MGLILPSFYPDRKLPLGIGIAHIFKIVDLTLFKGDTTIIGKEKDNEMVIDAKWVKDFPLNKLVTLACILETKIVKKK